MRKRDRNIIVLSLTSFAVDVTFGSWWLILPLYLERLGASVTDIGLSYALINIAWALSQLPGGYLSDRFGRKRIIVISTSTFIPFYASMLFLRDWLSVTAAITLSSFFAGLQNPSFSSMIVESSSKLGLAEAFGFYNFLMNLGWAVGPLIGAFITPNYGFDPVFAAGTVVTAICFLLRAKLLSEPSTLSVKTDATSFSSFLMPVSLSIFIFQVANGLISPLIPLYAEKYMKFDMSQIQLMFFAAQLLTSLSSLMAGPFVTKLGGLKSLLISFTFSGMFSLAWPFSRSFGAFILLSLYYAFLFAFTEVAFGTFLSEITVRENRATAFGAATIISGLSHSLGGYLGGNIWESFDPLVPFVLTFSLTIVSIVPLMRARF